MANAPSPLSELDALDPVPEQVKLTSGTVVVLEDLKARQFFKLLRIVTHGAMPLMQDMSLFKLDPDTDPGEFTSRLLSILVLSIPDAEDETIEFIASMCKPYGLIEDRRLNKQDAERNEELWRRLAKDLDNPELDDLVTLIEAVVRRESADIQALGKRLAAMFKLADRTGQLRTPQTTETPTETPTSSPDQTSVRTPDSSADSPAPSISWPPSTAGTTTTSGLSHSGASVSVSPPSGNAGTTPGGSDSNG